MASRRVIDLSQPVGPDTPVYPGDGPVSVTILEQGHMNLSRMEYSVHTGTHMDAPFHFVESGKTIDQIDLSDCMGPARLLDVRATAEIRREHLEPHQLRGTSAVVLHTGWSEHWGGLRYFDDHPCLQADGAEFLVECGVRLVAVDMPSVDRAPHTAHQILLSVGVLIVENLTNLEAIGTDRFELIVLPLKLAGRDGSPVRAVAVC